MKAHFVGGGGEKTAAAMAAVGYLLAKLAAVLAISMANRDFDMLCNTFSRLKQRSFLAIFGEGGVAANFAK